MSKQPTWITPSLRTDGSSTENELDKFKDGISLRHPFDRDYGIISHSSKFRRLSGKTQVFLSPKSDFPRTRLTHSIEVAQVGRQLASIFRKHFEKIYPDHHLGSMGSFERLTETACIAHDLGHPPFGHLGAKTLEKLCEEQGCEFDDNKHVVYYFLSNSDVEKPLPVTEILVDATMKYKNKSAWYAEEDSVCRKLIQRTGTNHYRHPVTYLMEAADDLVNFSSDLEDAASLDVLSANGQNHFIAQIIPKAEDRKDNIKNNVSLIMKNALRDLSDSIEEALVFCKNKSEDPDHIPEYFEMFMLEKNANNNDLKEKEKEKLNLFSLKKLYKSILLKELYFHKEYGILKHESVKRPEKYARSIIQGLWEKLDELGKKYNSYEDASQDQMVNFLPADKVNWLKDNYTSLKDPVKRGKYISRYIAGMTDHYCIYLHEKCHESSTSLYKNSLTI